MGSLPGTVVVSFAVVGVWVVAAVVLGLSTMLATPVSVMRGRLGLVRSAIRTYWKEVDPEQRRQPAFRLEAHSRRPGRSDYPAEKRRADLMMCVVGGDDAYCLDVARRDLGDWVEETFEEYGVKEDYAALELFTRAVLDLCMNGPAQTPGGAAEHRSGPTSTSSHSL